ncbi:hypothetical protein GOP47_0020415 [Adiantum capillus-veneris]|uniref:Vacuolar ATPase assembly integral membrane protein VMA21 homolog n=1 Tax=Adiantum capillus-veneris TaxID=13818 RepID=A0A9D4UD81_ADICA|nr:hypothetical protein GOP47_0020415 [Adiantum capillus-veneris]
MMETAQVMKRFLGASLAMWGFPLLILHLFNRFVKPGMAALSPRWHTICSGCLAVLSVNVVIAIYIVMAMREPRSVAEPHPDPTFVSRAKASLLQACQEEQDSEREKKDS